LGTFWNKFYHTEIKIWIEMARVFGKKVIIPKTEAALSI
jgi:hypothetical protein